MAKRKKKEAPAAASSNGSAQSFAQRLRADSNKLHELKLACGHLKRSATWGPDQIEKFINRVFAIAGVEEPAPAQQASAEAQ